MYEDIKEQFKEVIRHSQGIKNPKVDLLFKDWKKAKSKYINLFGGLIYEWPEQIEFMLDEHSKVIRAAEFVDCVESNFRNPELASFLDKNLDSFFDNIVSESEYNNIPKGMKLLKAFKYFESDKKVLREMQDMASQIIQENKIKGKLCFSVHPLDFLSSSENSYNWRTCHSLDGDYRAGNLSYMVDNTTFMVYLKGADKCYYPAFGDVAWNSKKWRMLIHESTNNSIMFAGRQYPFSSKAGIDIVLNIYNNIKSEYYERIKKKKAMYYYMPIYYNEWSSNYVETYKDDKGEEHLLNEKYIIFNNKLKPLSEAITEGDRALNFNDVLRSSCYEYPYYATLRPPMNYFLLDFDPIEVGGKVPCLQCESDFILSTETMRCDNCELKYGTEENDTYGTCACCGARLYIDDAPEVGDLGEAVCDACYKSECFICDECGEAFFNTDKVITTKDDGVVEYCHHCAKLLFKEE